MLQTNYFKDTNYVPESLSAVDIQWIMLYRPPTPITNCINLSST